MVGVEVLGCVPAAVSRQRGSTAPELSPRTRAATKTTSIKTNHAEDLWRSFSDSALWLQPLGDQQQCFSPKLKIIRSKYEQTGTEALGNETSLLRWDGVAESGLSMNGRVSPGELEQSGAVMSSD